jgi:hypothetical protein
MDAADQAFLMQLAQCSQALFHQDRGWGEAGDNDINRR